MKITCFTRNLIWDLKALAKFDIWLFWIHFKRIMANLILKLASCFPSWSNFLEEKIQKNLAAYSKLFIIYIWIYSINIGFMLWFHDLFKVNNVWVILSGKGSSLPLSTDHMHGPHPLCQRWRSCGKLYEETGLSES